MRFFLIPILSSTLFQCFCQPGQLPPLEQFVGYYDVGVKPNKPFFKSRWYLREGKLFTIYDSDIDRELIPYAKGELSPTIFLNEKEVRITDTDSTYYLVLNFEDARLQSFKVIRPRKIWPTNLYGYRNGKLTGLAVDTEKDLTLFKETAHFLFHYSEIDTAVVQEMAEIMEDAYPSITSRFNLATFPLTTIRIYPTLDTYHNAVLTPGAPKWQMGRAWDTHEIRMLSPVKAHQITGEVVDTGKITLHEFVHCLHLSAISDTQRPPGWLWEGLALYVGCCQWIQNPFDLEYMRKGNYPSIKQIERDQTYQKKYDLGYYFIEFLDKVFGWDKVQELVTNNGDIRMTVGISTKQFEHQFYEYLETTYR